MGNPTTRTRAKFNQITSLVRTLARIVCALCTSIQRGQKHKQARVPFLEQWHHFDLQHICQAIMDELLWFGFPVFFRWSKLLRFLLTSYVEDKMSKILVKLFKIAGIFVRRPIHCFCSCDTSPRNLSRNGGCEARDRPQHNGVIPKQDGGESK